MSAVAVPYPRLLLIFPAWLALLFYLPTLAHGFVWDDTYFLRDLPYLRDPALWWQALQEPLFVSRNYFRPLPLLTFVLEARLGGSQAFVFHALNVLVHMLNTTLVVMLARSILPEDRRGLWAASAAGILFALHPVLVENVSWISDRFDLLMASFILTALWCERRMSHGWRRDLAQTLCLLAALLCKETGIVLLPLLLLWQVFLMLDSGATWSAVPASLRVRWRLWSGLLLALLVYLALRYAAFGFLYRSNSSLLAGDPLQHLLLIGKTLGWYLLLLFFPFGQVAPVHPATTPLVLSDAWAWLGLCTSIALFAGLLYAVWRGRSIALLGLMGLVALGPVSNLLPLTTGDNIVHDRYLLLTVVFVSLMLSRCLTVSISPLILQGVGLWLLASAVTVMTIVPHWETDASLWTWAYHRYPDSQIASENYMVVLVNAERNEEALALVAELLRPGLGLHYGAAYHMRAHVLHRMGRIGEAEVAIIHSLDIPRQNDAFGAYLVSEKLNLLARIQMQQGRYAAAGENLRESIRLTPYMARSHYLLAVWYYRQGQLAEGDAAFVPVQRYALPDYVKAFQNEADIERQQALERS